MKDLYKEPGTERTRLGDLLKVLAADSKLRPFAEFMDIQDQWVPAATLDQMLDVDLQALFAISEEIRKMSENNIFYAFYKQIVDKVILLLLERNPDDFNFLRPEQQEAVFGFKIEIPTEQALYAQVYFYIENPREAVKNRVFYPGRNFSDIMDELVNNSKASPQLAQHLRAIDADYSFYYLQQRKQTT